MKIIKPFNLYVLKLVKDKYYIGTTYRKLQLRLMEHTDELGLGLGAAWTQLYKPLEVVEFFQTIDKFKEDEYTKKYMEIFGIENVRGGSYCQLILPDYQIKSLKKEFETINDLCFKCGKKGHFASNCKISCSKLHI